MSGWQKGGHRRSHPVSALRLSNHSLRPPIPEPNKETPLLHCRDVWSGPSARRTTHHQWHDCLTSQLAASDTLTIKIKMEEDYPMIEHSATTLTEDIFLQIFLQLEPSLQQLTTLSRVSRSFHRLVQHPLLWERVFHASGYVLPTHLQSRLRGTLQGPPGRWNDSHFEWDATTGFEDEKELEDEWTLMKPSIRCSIHNREPLPKHSKSPRDLWSSFDAAPGPDRDSEAARQGALEEKRHEEDERFSAGVAPSQIPIHWPTLLRSMNTYDSRFAGADTSRSTILEGHSKAVYTVAFQGSRMVSASRDQSIGFWRLGAADARGRVTETKLIARMDTPHSRSVVSIAFDFDCETPFDSEGDDEAVPGAEPRDRASMLVSSSSDGSVAIWRVVWTDKRPAQGEEETPIETELLRIRRDSPGPVFHVTLTPSRIVTAAADGFIRTYDRRTLELAETLENGPKAVNTVVQTAPGEEAFVAVGLDHTIVEYTRIEEGSWHQATTKILDFKLATLDIRDGYFAVGGEERLVRIYRHGETRERFRGHIDTIRAIALDRGRPLMVSADYQGHILIWDLRKSRLLRIERSPDQTPVFGIHMREGRLVAALGDGSMLELVFGMGLPYQALLHQMRQTAPLKCGKDS